MDSYADSEFYKNTFKSVTIPDNELEQKLYMASRHIDSLTFNRIVGKGFPMLTSFQQEIVQMVCCKMADFEYENSDMINSVLQSYSVNGVSMQFGNSWNVKVVSGIVVQSETYQYLSQTGLCSLGLR